MSAIQLERQLKYERIAWIEVVEVVAYQSTAVVLALAGFGVWSFACAIITRGCIGSVLLYVAAPWRVRLAFDRSTARSILAYGLPFQGQMIANSVGGWITPIVVGAFIGPNAVGYLSWASGNGRKPLVLVDNVMRVAFPHFSRLQEDRAEVERTLARYLALLLFAAGFWFALIVAAGPVFVRWVYTDRWLPAVPALILYSGTVGGEAVLWVVGVALNSIGSVSYTTRAVMLRTVSVVFLSILLIARLGFNGVPLAGLITAAVAAPYMLRGFGAGAPRRILGPSVWVAFPTAAAIAFGLVIQGIDLPLAASTLSALIGTASAYIACGWLAAPDSARGALRRRLRMRGPIPGFGATGGSRDPAPL